MNLEKVYLKKLTHRSDVRGEFVKFMTGTEKNMKIYFGEIYFVTVLPKQNRASHFHNLANEWFTVIDGKLVILLEDITSKKQVEYILDSKSRNILYVPAGIAHKIYNPSPTLISSLLAYSDHKYDVADTITYSF